MAGAVPEQHLVVMGAGGVGKTTLIVQFVQHRFVADYEPTIEDSYRKQLIIDSDPCILDILDTAGQEEYAALKDQYMQTGEGFYLVYSILDRTTFEEVKDTRAQILKVKNTTSIPLIVVGNKADLASQREVNTEEGKKLSDSWNVPFFEASAKDGTNVEESWIELVRELRKYRKTITSPTPTTNGTTDKKNPEEGSKKNCCVIL